METKLKKSSLRKNDFYYLPWSIFLLVFVICLGQPSIAAQTIKLETVPSLRGSWIGIIETAGFSGKMELEIAGEAGKPEAHLKLTSAGQDFSEQLTNFKVSGDEISFLTGMEILEIKYRLNFSGKLSGDDLRGNLSGTLADSATLTGTWVLKRQVTTQKDGNFGVELPLPTGKYKVGRRHFNWVDNSRQETMTEDPTDHRELVVEISYPSDERNPMPPSPYFSGLESLEDNVSAAFFSQINQLSSHAIDGARLAVEPKKYPVLIFSPGSGISVSFYSMLIEELASKGYVVVAMAPPYEVLEVTLSNNRNAANTDEDKVKDYLAYAKERIFERSSDASYVLGKLTELNRDKKGWLGNRLDLTRVGIFGHSRGGTAAAQTCLADKRFKACLNLDGGTLGRPFYPDSNRGNPDQVLMWFQRFHDDPSDEQLKSWKMNRQQSDQNLDRIQSRVNSLFQNLRLKSYRLTVSGATHMSFSDTPLLEPNLSLDDLAARLRTMRIVRTYTLTLFDKYLKGQESILLDGSSGDFPEVILEQFRTMAL